MKNCLLASLSVIAMLASTPALSAHRACMQDVTGIYGNTKTCFENLPLNEGGLEDEQFEYICESKMVPPTDEMSVSATYLDTGCPPSYKAACLNANMAPGLEQKLPYDLYHYENAMAVMKKACERANGEWLEGK